MFILSKILWLLLSPLNLALALLLAGLALPRFGWKKAGRRIHLAVVSWLTLVAVIPWSPLLLEPLEERFPAPAEYPSKVDGMIVLGGAFDPVASKLRGQISANGAVERVTAMVELARRNPQARIIFSGGSGSIFDQEYKEAAVVQDFLRGIGFESDRMIYEDQSRNTRENAVFSKKSADPQPGEKWLLVTSALHMPRSMGAFRTAGWDVSAFPVDYQTDGRRDLTPSFNLSSGMSVLGAVLHEALGMAYYRLRGWSDNLYPAP